MALAPVDLSSLSLNYRMTAGSGNSRADSYAYDFTGEGGKSYTFIPQSVVNSGVRGGGDSQFILPWFLNQDNLSSLTNNAHKVDFSDMPIDGVDGRTVTGAEYFGDMSKNSAQGFLIETGSIPFDSKVTVIPKDQGEITGMSLYEGRPVYAQKSNNSNAISYIADDNGEVRINTVTYTPGRSILGDIFGGAGDAVAGLINGGIDAFQSLGPLGTAAITAWNPVAGAAIAGANTGRAIANGAPLSDIALNLAANYAGSQLGGLAGDEYGSAAGQMAGNTASGVLKGQGFNEALTNAALSTAGSQGSGALSNEMSDQQLSDWSQKNAEAAYNNAPSPTEQDVLSADNTIPLPSPLTSVTPENSGAGYYDETNGQFVSDPNGGMRAPLTEASGNNLDSMDGYTYNPDTQTWEMPNGEVVSFNGSTEGQPELSNTQTPYEAPPVETTPPESFDPNTKINKAVAGALVKAVTPTSSSSASNSSQASNQGNASPLSSLASQKLDSSPQFLTSKYAPNQTPILKGLKHLYGSVDGDAVAPLAMAAVANQSNNEPQQEESKFMATGGSTNDTGFSLNPPKLTEYRPTVLAAAPVVEHKSRISPLRGLTARSLHQEPYAMAKGGLPAKYAEALPEGHKPEFITGLTGYYAQGKGTGQSDDIDAMLHQGDYVADADLVAALGDGSSKAGAEALEKFRRSVPHQEHAEGGTAVAAKIADGEYVFPASFVTAIGSGDNKAGAKILDKMREAIREHKRSAPTTKIPPKAKSPLDYLKMVKG